MQLYLHFLEYCNESQIIAMYLKLLTRLIDYMEQISVNLIHLI